MNKRLILLLSLSALGLLAVAGCQSSNPCCRKPLVQRPLFPNVRARLNRGNCCDAGPGAPMVAAPTPIGPAPVGEIPPLAPAAAPPGAYPPPPAYPPPAANGGAYAPPPAPPAGNGYIPPPNGNGGASNYPPPQDTHSYRPTWTPSTTFAEPPPAQAGARLSTPEPAAPTPTPNRVQLQTPEPPTAPRQPAPTAPTPSLPVGIPNFAAAPDDGVTVGLKPSLDGFDWLQQNRYRSVLHVVAPGEDDSADKKLVEKHSMNYTSVTLSPNGVARAVEEFNRIVGSKVLHPLFVYDRDGMLTGSLWYLHFRSKGDSDEVARGKAIPLGLQMNPTGDNQTLWVAIQKYVSERK